MLVELTATQFEEMEYLRTHTAGHWASLRQEFLEENRNEEWRMMIKNGTARQYLKDFQEEMSDRFIDILERQALKLGATEECKMRDVLEYIRRYNQAQQIATEILMPEVRA